MFPYTVKYTESKYDIQNNDLLYKIDQQSQNTFELLETFVNFQKRMETSKCYFVICINYEHHRNPVRKGIYKRVRKGGRRTPGRPRYYNGSAPRTATAVVFVQVFVQVFVKAFVKVFVKVFKVF